MSYWLLQGTYSVYQKAFHETFGTVPYKIHTLLSNIVLIFGLFPKEFQLATIQFPSLKKSRITISYIDKQYVEDIHYFTEITHLIRLSIDCLLISGEAIH